MYPASRYLACGWLSGRNELRKWFGRDPMRWDGLRQRYFKERRHTPDAVEPIRDLLRQGK